MQRLNLLSVTVAVLTVALSCILSTTTFAERANPYAGFKIPPLPVPSSTRYAYKTVDVLGSNMAYVESGRGDPILFLHGVPTSSYLWRNVMPHVEKQGHVIALDLIGFGKSDQPPLDYSFADHYRYVEAFVETMDLHNITLVMHDWGSGLGLHYARLNTDRIKAIVTMESIVAPIMPADNYDTMPRGSANFFRKVRAPLSGAKLIIEDNYFIERVLPNSIVRPLSPRAHDVYREPFPNERSRIQINQWPNQMPIGGNPKDVHEIVAAYNDWLQRTELPWLFLYASPGTLNPPEAAEYWTGHAQNIETAFIGAGIHYVQEDQPYAIGRAISDWYRRLPVSEH